MQPSRPPFVIKNEKATISSTIAAVDSSQTNSRNKITNQTECIPQQSTLEESCFALKEAYPNEALGELNGSALPTAKPTGTRKPTMRISCSIGVQNCFDDEVRIQSAPADTLYSWRKNYQHFMAERVEKLDLTNTKDDRDINHNSYSSDTYSHRSSQDDYLKSPTIELS